MSLIVVTLSRYHSLSLSLSLSRASTLPSSLFLPLITPSIRLLFSFHLYLYLSLSLACPSVSSPFYLSPLSRCNLFGPLSRPLPCGLSSLSYVWEVFSSSLQVDLYWKSSSKRWKYWYASLSLPVSLSLSLSPSVFLSLFSSPFSHSLYLYISTYHDFLTLLLSISLNTSVAFEDKHILIDGRQIYVQIISPMNELDYKGENSFLSLSLSLPHHFSFSMSLSISPHLSLYLSTTLSYSALTPWTHPGLVLFLHGIGADAASSLLLHSKTMAKRGLVVVNFDYEGNSPSLSPSLSCSLSLFLYLFLLLLFQTPILSLTQTFPSHLLRFHHSTTLSFLLPLHPTCK